MNNIRICLIFFISFVLLSVLFWAIKITFFGLFIDSDYTLKVYFLDIGQGDSVYIRTPNGNDMLIDAGPSRSVLRRLAEVMPWHDREIDVVVVTHPDADHIGGMPDVLSAYKVGFFIESGVESKNLIDDEVDRLIGLYDIEKITARAGTRINFGENVYFDIIFPDKDPSTMKTNDASIVGRMVFASTSIMLTGDSSKAIENYLIKKYGKVLKSDILKVGHHGSNTSSGENYVRIIDPDYAVISSGKDNRYKHPHSDVLAIFEKLKIPVFRTDILGTIFFESDGKIFRGPE